MSSKDTFNVAVTGNPPFHEYKFNTSQLVRDALPNIISRAGGQKDIRIWKYHRDTLDTYDDVRRVSREIWMGDISSFTEVSECDLAASSPQTKKNTKHVDIDLILHLGMAALGYPSDEFHFETIARRDGYVLPGDDGKLVDSEQLKSLGLPAILSTSFDVHAAWRQVKQKFREVPAYLSEDAGLYFCEFRLYSSLAEPLLSDSLRHKQGRVAFEHLPQAHDPESIALARDVTIAFITGLLDSPLVAADEKS